MSLADRITVADVTYVRVVPLNECKRLISDLMVASLDCAFAKPGTSQEQTTKLAFTRAAQAIVDRVSE